MLHIRFLDIRKDERCFRHLQSPIIDSLKFLPNGSSISATYNLIINVLTLHIRRHICSSWRDVRYHIWISTSIGFLPYLFFNRSPIYGAFPSKTFVREIALLRVATRCCRRIRRVFHLECMYMYINNFALCCIKDCALDKCVSFARLIIGKRQEWTLDIQFTLSRVLFCYFWTFVYNGFFLTVRRPYATSM